MSSFPYGGIQAPDTQPRDEPVGHRCGLCFGPFGKSAIRCKNEPTTPTTRDEEKN